jgi:hypothetical protein
MRVLLGDFTSSKYAGWSDEFRAGLRDWNGSGDAKEGEKDSSSFVLHDSEVEARNCRWLESRKWIKRTGLGEEKDGKECRRMYMFTEHRTCRKCSEKNE